MNDQPLYHIAKLIGEREWAVTDIYDSPYKDPLFKAVCAASRALEKDPCISECRIYRCIDGVINAELVRTVTRNCSWCDAPAAKFIKFEAQYLCNEHVVVGESK